MNLFKEIKNWKQGYVKYLKYDFKLTCWLYLNRWRKFVLFLKQHFGLIRRSLLVVAGVTIGLFINHLGGGGFTKDVLSNFLVAVGAMTGGTIAIIFSISIFLLQGVADLYSSKYLEDYINDWKDQFTYFIVIAITLLFFGAGLFVGGLTTVAIETSSRIVLGSLALIGVVFSFIDWQYERVRAKLAPVNAILFLERKGLGFLRQLVNNADKIADLIAAREVSLSKDMALAAAYNRVLQPFIKDLDRQLETLVEVSMKLSDRHEIETTKRGFTAMHNLLGKFLEARKTSSLAIPSASTFLATESDSQSFLNKNFERLNKAGEKFLAEGKEENATHIIDIYNSLAAKAKEIVFTPSHNENPILDNLVGNLNYFIENGKRVKNIEVAFQGARVLGDIALMCSEKGYPTTLKGIQDNLRDIAIFGLTEKCTVIVDRCVDIYLNILRSVFVSDKIIARYQFDDCLKNISTLTLYADTLRKSGYLPDNFTTRISLSKGYNDLYLSVATIFNHYFNLTDARAKKTYRSNLIELFEDINSSLRNLSEKLKECTSPLVDSIGRLLQQLNRLMVQMIINDEFKDIKKELENKLNWNIHLPSWFVHYAGKFESTNGFDTLIECVAHTGIILFENYKDEDLLQACVTSIYSIAKQSLEKITDPYGYTEPRIMMKIVYLGVLALKNGNQDLLADIGFKIYEFEEGYFKKHIAPITLPVGVDPKNVRGLPQEDQLENEAYRWRHDFSTGKYNRMRLMHSASDLMYDMVDENDIDRFLFEIWGSIPSHSAVADELLENTKKKFLRRKLVDLIRKIADAKK